MDFTANEGSGLNSTGGSNPPVSATKPRLTLVNRGFLYLHGTLLAGVPLTAKCGDAAATFGG